MSEIGRFMDAIVEMSETIAKVAKGLRELNDRLVVVERKLAQLEPPKE